MPLKPVFLLNLANRGTKHQSLMYNCTRRKKIYKIILNLNHGTTNSNLAGYLEGSTACGTKGVYDVSLSAASRWAFWNSFRTAWKSFASLASVIFLLACMKQMY